MQVDRPEIRNRQGFPPPAPPVHKERVMANNKKPRIGKDGAVSVRLIYRAVKPVLAWFSPARLR